MSPFHGSLFSESIEFAELILTYFSESIEFVELILTNSNRILEVDRDISHVLAMRTASRSSLGIGSKNIINKYYVLIQ